jgi:uncharacterized small protein (DUF1192 family)
MRADADSSNAELSRRIGALRSELAAAQAETDARVSEAEQEGQAAVEAAMVSVWEVCRYAC